MEKEKSLTKRELDFSDLLEEVFITKIGKKTISELIKQFGDPKIVVEYAKLEAKTGSTARPTIIVERYIDGKLIFSPDIVIKGIKKSMIPMFNCNGIERVYVRSGGYDPSKLIKATQSEIAKST